MRLKKGLHDCARARAGLTDHDFLLVQHLDGRGPLANKPVCGRCDESVRMVCKRFRPDIQISGGLAHNCDINIASAQQLDEFLAIAHLDDNLNPGVFLSERGE